MIKPILLIVLFLGQFSYAVGLVPFSEPEALERLNRSQHRADFAKLANHYLNQTDRIICAPVVGSIVLNALRYNTEKAPLVDIPKPFFDQIQKATANKLDPRLRMYTPQNFLNNTALEIKSLSRIYAEPVSGQVDPGLQLEQFRRVFEEAHGVAVKKMPVGTKETARNKEGFKPLPQEEYERVVGELKKNLSEPNNFVVINYSRAELKQVGSGHFSPVAAYDEESDSFLVLDVNPFGGPWVWVDASDLVNAMNTFDTEENRGILFVSEK